MPRKPQFGRIYRRKWKRPDGTRIELPTWWIEYYSDGTQRRESSESEKYSAAEALLKRRQAEVTLGKAPRAGLQKVKVSSLLDLLLADYEINRKSLKWAQYVDGHLRPAFGNLRAISVGTDALARYISQRRAEGAANATINRELSLLRRAFYLGQNAEPPLVAAVPRIQKLEEHNVRKGFFDHEHFLLLRTELPEHLRPVITFAYATGCRKGEILSLLWSQVDLIARVVRLEPGETKNSEARTIPLIGELFDMLVLLTEQRDQTYPSCPFVFSRYGKRIRNFYGAWLEASERAGLVDEAGKAKRLFHDLRRTGVRNLIRAGVPERVAMMISGHKTRSVLDRYNVVDERDILVAGQRLETYLQAQSEGAKAKSRSSAAQPTSDRAISQQAKAKPKFLN
jgi:integrase